jgi:hypothetical protein
VKTKTHITTSYNVYDLSNSHFQNAEIVTSDNIKIKGQFVRFRVTENIIGVKIYPSEKYCFLPIDYKKEFWDTFKLNDGQFNEFPPYIKIVGLNEIKKIIIKPTLI